MADSMFAPRQWKTALLGNDVSHGMDTRLESAQMSVPTPNDNAHKLPAGRELNNGSNNEKYIWKPR